jgi:hypothetical protein
LLDVITGTNDGVDKQDVEELIKANGGYFHQRKESAQILIAEIPSMFIKTALNLFSQ